MEVWDVYERDRPGGGGTGKVRLGHDKYKVAAPAVLHLQSVPDDGSGWGEECSANPNSRE